MLQVMQKPKKLLTLVLHFSTTVHKVKDFCGFVSLLASLQVPQQDYASLHVSSRASSGDPRHFQTSSVSSSMLWEVRLFLISLVVPKNSPTTALVCIELMSRPTFLCLASTLPIWRI